MLMLLLLQKALNLSHIPCRLSHVDPAHIAWMTRPIDRSVMRSGLKQRRFGVGNADCCGARLRSRQKNSDDVGGS
jgi:hypothetical protein